ncbi:MAG: glycosyltransferase [Patescibacteria group bacterium]|jgi:glycosyltransferase involved in cell wall biosynthesis
MGIGNQKISACIVVYNEEKLIERCLKSIYGFVDEIILVHDGECLDKTLEIAKKYTDKIFIREHIGIAEPHRSFSYREAKNEWILQVDADEYFAKEDLEKISNLLETGIADGYWIKWEMWNGKEAVRIDGLKKMALFKKSKASNLGIPQVAVAINGKTENVDILLHHKPLTENISWKFFLKKMNYWLVSNVKYYFPELVEYECFNADINPWIEYTKKVHKYPFFYIFFYPLKNFFGQLKNGLWKTPLGINMAIQQFVYYFSLYSRVWKMDRKLKSH